MATRPQELFDSPLSDEQASALERLAATLDRDRLNWVSGYLAGRATVEAPAPIPSASAPPVRQERLTILYGSETGNARGLAMRVHEQAAAHGIGSRVVDMAEYQSRELRNERFLLVITATHGEGSPPDPAAGFFEFLHSRKAPKLPEARFAVLALGDSSYEHFCQTGRDFDARLEALGASRLRNRVDCDVDFAEPAAEWIEGAIAAFQAEMQSEAGSQPAPVLAFSRSTAAPQGNEHRTFSAEVLENLNLNGRGSPRETRHLELSLEDSGLTYSPGDVVKLTPRNAPSVVEALIHSLGLDPSSEVAVGNTRKDLRDALQTDLEVTTASPRFLEAWSKRSNAPALRDLLREESREARRRYLNEHWLIDIVREYPIEGGITPADLVTMLRPLKPREYSIASSLRACPEELHITVAAVRFASGGEARCGVASGFLADSVEPGDRVDIEIRENPHFRLPADPELPVIMIGPGTGVAPYRAFLQEREVIGANGRNWLFFGNPYFRTDFLYQTEWQRWLANGVLTRLELAFSRDQSEKIYVQDRLRACGGEIFRWLEEGAHIYVCGDSSRMAPDVHTALLEILGTHGGLSEKRAREYLSDLQSARRYQRDTY